MLPNHKGTQYEAAACTWLRKKGCRLLVRNYHCRFGEIDLVMLDDCCLAFVEVRYRDNPGWGSVLESVDRHKQQRIRMTASHYLQRNAGMQSLACRFDVLGICRDPNGNYLYHWIRDAFV